MSPLVTHPSPQPLDLIERQSTAKWSLTDMTRVRHYDARCHMTSRSEGVALTDRRFYVSCDFEMIITADSEDTIGAA